MLEGEFEVEFERGAALCRLERELKLETELEIAFEAELKNEGGAGLYGIRDIKAGS